MKLRKSKKNRVNFPKPKFIAVAHAMAGNFIILEVTEIGWRIGPFKASLGNAKLIQSHNVTIDTVDGWNPAPPGMYETL